MALKVSRSSNVWSRLSFQYHQILLSEICSLHHVRVIGILTRCCVGVEIIKWNLNNRNEYMTVNPSTMVSVLVEVAKLIVFPASHL